jgi:hypothetical protein
MYNGLGDAVVAAFFVCLAAGVAVGLLLAWLIPLLWAWVKPWLHALTG